jgi:hypothetical protein
LGHEAHHSPPSTAEVMNATRLHGLVFN